MDTMRSIMAPKKCPGCGEMSYYPKRAMPGTMKIVSRSRCADCGFEEGVEGKEIKGRMDED